MQSRTAEVKRATKETQIELRLTIDGRGEADVQTGLGFFNHMLTLFAKHAVMDLKLQCKGDLEVDAHHTVEDCGIALGQAFLDALGDKKGIRRYGMSLMPMDECLARCVVDFSGRPYLVWRGMDELAFKQLPIAGKPQDMAMAFRFGLAREFFQGFTNEARCNLHLELFYGQEPHHVVEAIFKAFARAVDAACQRDPRIAGQLPSTKGLL
ncbi:MAG TPA: imidazoleglycerol-phosphate dehydratase HisB [Verrucomicrobiae bacterium]|nr:imidazoleglycerol-phosphate dehydratase HisB [Verrucomicrobiae bacterium]